MNKNALTVFKADIQAQMALVNRILTLVEERATGLTPNDPIRLESVAYQIHNLYNAIEDLLQLIVWVIQ